MGSCRRQRSRVEFNDFTRTPPPASGLVLTGLWIEAGETISEFSNSTGRLSSVISEQATGIDLEWYRLFFLFSQEGARGRSTQVGYGELVENVKQWVND